jgi:PHD/YefM family antitoxin component YafN of YafNO toxin-antitoxin module
MKIVPAKTLRTQSTRLLNRLKRERTTLLTDDHGRATAYLLAADEYEGMQSRIRLLEGIARGEKAILDGRTLTHAQARKRLARWLER